MTDNVEEISVCIGYSKNLSENCELDKESIHLKIANHSKSLWHVIIFNIAETAEIYESLSWYEI